MNPYPISFRGQPKKDSWLWLVFYVPFIIKENVYKRLKTNSKLKLTCRPFRFAGGGAAKAETKTKDARSSTCIFSIFHLNEAFEAMLLSFYNSSFGVAKLLLLGKS